jgi:hypothetical protein
MWRAGQLPLLVDTQSFFLDTAQYPFEGRPVLTQQDEAFIR